MYFLMGGYVRDGVGPPAKTPAKTPSNCHGGLLYISPPLMNLNVPSGWGVTHDVGNARLPSERASPGRGRLGMLRFDCCVEFTYKTALEVVMYFLHPPLESDQTNRIQRRP